MSWIKRQVWFLARFANYFITNFLWNTLFYNLCKLLNKQGRPLFGFVFLVYPGTANQARGYAPAWYRHIAPTLSVIGVVRGKEHACWGLVMTIPWMIRELRKEKQRVSLWLVLKKLRCIAEAIGAKSIALAGRLPSVISRNGFPEMLTMPFVTGERGTLYTILLSAKQAASSAGVNLHDLTVGVLGYGFIGSKLVELLRNNGVKRVVCVDPVAIRTVEQDDHSILTRDPAFLVECDLVVILTARGDQADVAVNYLKPGVIVVDDTHPQMPSRLSGKIWDNGGHVVKAVLGLKEIHFIPRLPRWESDWLPGCCVEALVATAKGFTETQAEFNKLADQMGFVALEVTNRSDL